MKTKTLFLILATVLAMCLPSQAVDPPGILNHQGRIAVNGANHDGTGYFKFALVTGGGATSLWSNDGTSNGGAEPTAAVSVPVSKGHYAVMLGDTTLTNMTQAIPAAVFTGNADVSLRLWFSTASGGPFELLAPDRRIASTGYAMAASQASAVAPGGVTSEMLAYGAVTSAKIARGAVTSSAVADGSISARDLALGATGLVRKPVLLSEVSGAAGGLVFSPMSLTLDPAGSLDPSFGTGGKVTAHSGADDTAFAVTIQDDGKIVVAGHSDNEESGYVVGRFLANGSIDPSFGTNGFSLFGDGVIWGDQWEEFRSVAVDENGAIYAGGLYNASSFALAKLHPNGTLDGSFGTGGIVFPKSGNYHTELPEDGTGVHTVLLQDDGKIILVGCSVYVTDPEHLWGPQAFAIVRCNLDGSTNTRLIDPIGGNTRAFATGGALQPDGKILVAGYSDINGTNDFVIARYDSSFSRDSGFGTDGWVITDFGGADYAEEVGVMDDGRIVVAGYSGGDIAIARYLANGSPDPAFGSGGKAVLDVDSYCRIYALRLDEAGRICVAGNQDGNFIVARFTSAGTPDPMFGSGGVVVTDFGGLNDFARGLAIDGQSRLVVSGYTDGPDPGGDFALARYLGSPGWTGDTASVCVADEIAYQVGSNAGAGYLRIIDLADPSAPEVLSETFHPTALCDLEGARDVFVDGATAYVVSEKNGSLNILDVGDPADPQLVSILTDGSGGYGNLGGAWSVVVSGTTAYVAAVTDSALTIIDVSNPASPAKRAEVMDNVGGFDHLAGARDVFVDGDTAYVTATNENALTIIDVGDPSSPVLLATVIDETGGFTKLAGAREVFVRDGIAYVTAEEDDALTIIDVSDPSAPALLAEVVDGFGGFNHLDGAAGVFVSGPVAMVSAEDDDAVTLIDIRDPVNPVVFSEIVDGVGNFQQLDGAEGVSIYGSLGFVASNGDRAVTILNLQSDSSAIVLPADSVTGLQILDGSIWNADFGDGSVDGRVVALHTLDGSHFQENRSFVNEHYGDNTVDKRVIAPNSVPIDKMSTEGAAGNQILYVDGSMHLAWRNPVDVLGDEDATNELQSWSNLPGIPTGFADGTDDVDDADADPSNELQNWSNLPGIPSGFLDGTDDVTDADANPTNEIQTLSLNGTTLSLSGGGGSVSLGGTVDNDADPTNEFQDLMLAGGVLSISDGSQASAMVDLGGFFLSDGSQPFGGTLNLDGNGVENVASLRSTSGGTNPLVFLSNLNMGSGKIYGVSNLGIGVSSESFGNVLQVESLDTGPGIPLFHHTMTGGWEQMHSVARFAAETVDDMSNGFGAGVVFEIADGTAGPTAVARVGGVRDGSDQRGALHFQTRDGTGLATRMEIDSDGNVSMNQDLYLGVSGTTNNTTIHFGEDGIETLTWLDVPDRFLFSNDLYATSFVISSDRNLKEDITPVDPAEVLERLEAVPVSTWNFRSDDDSLRHIGPMAQDFHAAFGFGSDDRHISTTDADGVAFAAIQALKRMLDEKDRQIEELEKRIERLERAKPVADE